MQREEDRRTIEDLEERLRALETERTELVQRVDVLQKVLRGSCGWVSAAAVPETCGAAACAAHTGT